MNSVRNVIGVTFFLLIVLFCTQERVCAETATLRVSGTVYADEKQPGVSMDSGATDWDAQTARKRHSSYELQDINVNAGRIETNQMIKPSEKISQVKMSPELVTKLPSIGQADLFRSLQLLPGVSAANEASSGLYVRGGTPDQNLIMLNKMPIYYVDHFYGFYSAFNPSAISEVSLYKGGFGAQYGGRLSSVVELTSSGKDITSDSTGVRASAGLGLLNSDVYVQLPMVNKNIGTLMIAGRRAMTDIFKTDLFNRLFNGKYGHDTASIDINKQRWGPMGTTLLSDDRIVYQPKFYFWDVNGLATFNLGSRGKLTTSFFESYDNQDNSLDTAWSKRAIVTWDSVRFDTTYRKTAIKNNDPVSWGNICFGQQWEQAWSDAFKTSLNLSYSQFLDEKGIDNYRTDSTAKHGSDTISPLDTTIVIGSAQWLESKNKIADISGRIDNSFKLSDWNTLNAGVEMSRKAVLYERDTTIPDTTIPGWNSFGNWVGPNNMPVHIYDTSMSMAVYAEDEMKFGGKAGLTPGLRAYWFQLAAASAIDPRISGWFKLFPGLKMKAAWGMYTQEIHRVEEEDITGGSKFIWLLANKERPLEKSQQIIAGASWENPHFLLDAEGYIKSISGLLTISERMRDDPWTPFAPNKLALFEGTGFSRGFELLAQVKNVRFPLFSKTAIYDGWAAYTWSRAENTFDVFNDGNPFPATQDHTHEIKLVNSLEWDIATWSSINFGAVWLYSTGAPYTAPLGMYAINLLDSTWARSYMHVSDKNAYRLPDYRRLDLSIAWKIRFGNHVESNLTIGLFNALNDENILERTYASKDVSEYTGNGGGKGGDEGFNPTGESRTIFIEMDKKAMSIMPNAALEIKARF
jgi:ferric enterobactin receptor